MGDDILIHDEKSAWSEKDWEPPTPALTLEDPLAQKHSLSPKNDLILATFVYIFIRRRQNVCNIFISHTHTHKHASKSIKCFCPSSARPLAIYATVITVSVDLIA